MLAVDDKPLRDIALLIGLPITEGEFSARLPCSDFLARFRPTNPGDDAQARAHANRAWTMHYFPTSAASLLELRGEAGRLGATVIPCATLADLRNATAKFEKVIVLSHWKGPEVSPEDILGSEPVGYRQRIEGLEDPVARTLREKFVEHGIGPAGLGAAPPRNAQAALLKALKATIEATIEQAGGKLIIEHPQTVQARRRDDIDAIFAGLLRPGNRLELFDGMHDKADIEVAIADEFSGVIDLTTCTSLTAGDYIAGKRGYRLRIVSFQVTIPPEWSSECVKLALNLTADGLPYLTARDRAMSLVRDSVEDEDRRRRGWWWSWLGRLTCGRSKKR